MRVRAHMCCLWARCRCSAHMCVCVCVCVRACMCVCVVMGHGPGPWGLRWAGGSSPWVLCSEGLCAPSLPVCILRLDAVRCPVGVNPFTKSLDWEPRRCQAPSPRPCGEAGPERTSPLTDHQDGQTCSPSRTLQDSPAWVAGAAPPAGSLGRCSRATSGLSFGTLGSRRFLALPGHCPPRVCRTWLQFCFTH